MKYMGGLIFGIIYALVIWWAYAGGGGGYIWKFMVFILDISIRENQYTGNFYHFYVGKNQVLIKYLCYLLQYVDTIPPLRPQITHSFCLT